MMSLQSQQTAAHSTKAQIQHKWGGLSHL